MIYHSMQATNEERDALERARPNAIHRNGQRGKLGALDANGFALFEYPLRARGSARTARSAKCSMPLATR
jgi:hypothetical protein